MADQSLWLGLTLVKPEIENTMPLSQRRESIFLSRRDLGWNKKKYMYCNDCEAGKLISINLSFAGNDLKPDIVTEIMGIKPDKASFKGQLFSSVTGRICQTGTWLISCEDDEDGHETFHDALMKSINDLYGYRKRIFQVAQEFNYESNISIAFNVSFNSGIFEHYRFSPDLFKALDSLGVDLALSIWMP